MPHAERPRGLLPARGGTTPVREKGVKRRRSARESVRTEFLCHHRDRSGSRALRMELLEEHWSYMDRFAKEMIARGPTLAADGEVPTGSVHILDLPDPAAARAFAFDEPGYQAGDYQDVLLRRRRDLLGRTMRDFPGGRTSARP
ncbi:hypothetical protein Shyhy01_72800 [Streptomyces hygroscopicus subsp. hygroscopicus]|nr:hypothetical protein Shyhy01_72800 [Streptomyces hygroscopicus subsp. hygroscopicus]